MNRDSTIPSLLHGPDGIGGELRQYVQTHGVEAIACRLLRELDNERQKVDHQRRESRVPEHIKQWAYVLQAYCRRHRYQPPTELMELTFEALELVEQKPAADLTQRLRLPAGVRDRPGFIEASRRDGEADAAGSPLSVKALADDLGVSRDTIRRWRERPEYNARREFAAMSLRYWQQHSNE
ncbi:hypothetical protein [Aquisalimonas asiatica]|uniref:Homeodomain-like domain-containing protein n=1 Tax=Aquisalimonas asiatica TaxID=406100 RepID=A0A1H8TPL0_9GAMM|nr:hypothetical protein [Aquisalimonas asiatica]SEO92554.1 hypothetical protein SAMN04488052_104346 [Aquisalimonas asiatica]